MPARGRHTRGIGECTRSGAQFSSGLIDWPSSTDASNLSHCSQARPPLMSGALFNAAASGHRWRTVDARLLEAAWYVVAARQGTGRRRWRGHTELKYKHGAHPLPAPSAAIMHPPASQGAAGRRPPRAGACLALPLTTALWQGGSSSPSSSRIGWTQWHTSPPPRGGGEGGLGVGRGRLTPERPTLPPLAVARAHPPAHPTPPLAQSGTHQPHLAVHAPTHPTNQPKL